MQYENFFFGWFELPDQIQNLKQARSRKGLEEKVAVADGETRSNLARQKHQRSSGADINAIIIECSVPSFFSTQKEKTKTRYIMQSSLVLLQNCNVTPKPTGSNVDNVTETLALVQAWTGFCHSTEVSMAM